MPSQVGLGTGATAVRRVLGPLAWSALEVLATQPRSPGERDVVTMSVRRLAVELGVATNTAQRALHALREAGLVEHAQRRADGGRFDIATYRLAIPHDVLNVDDAIQASGEPHHPSRSPSPAAPQRDPFVGQQLVLLPS